MNIPLRSLIPLSALLVTGLSPRSEAATFDGASRLSISDTDRTLTWNAASSALTVSCWVKFSIPSGVSLTENMMIVADRNTGTWTNNQLNESHSYAIYLSSTTGNIEFSSRGPGGYFTKTLVDKPFLERWYHLAVVRGGSGIKGYVDACKVMDDSIAVGDSKSTDGVTVGGFGPGMYLRGEVLEFEVFRATLLQSTIASYRFQDLNPATQSNLKGYYKLAASANASDNLRNFASSPSAGTDPAIKTGSGTLVFEATNRDGEQSLFDATKNGGRDAISPLAGGFDWAQTILTRPTPGVAFEFAINYSSGNAFNKAPLEDFDPFEPAPLGVGWRHSFEIRVLPNSAFNPSSGTMSLGLMTSEGNIETWDFLSASGDTTKLKTRHKEYRGELEFVGSSFDPQATVRWITPERLIYVFRSPFATNDDAPTLGRLKEIQDLNGNRLLVDIHKTGDKAGLVNTVTDSSGGVWTFNYDAQNRLQTLTGLGWTVTFSYANNRLSSRTLTGPAAYTVPASTTWSFLYTTSEPIGLLYRINDPRGNRDVEVTYDKYGRKTSGRDGMDRIATFQYNVPALRQMTTTRQAGSSPVPTNDRAVIDTFDRKLHVLTHKDALGNLTSFEYDDAGNVIAATDAKGNRSTMTYDARSNVLTTIDPLGRTTRREYNHVLAGGIPHNEPTKEIRPATEEAPSGWENRFTYDAAGNLLTHSDDIGTLAQHTYDAKGLVTSSKDGNTNETRFGYDANGFPNSLTIAFGTPEAATSPSTNSELGWTLTATTPLGETTTLAYNLYGQVVRTTDAIGRILTRAYDANGNLTEESDGNGALTKYQYNAADERTQRTDRLNNIWDFGYNTFGESITTTGPSVLSGGTTQRDTITNGYDANGRLVKITDPVNEFSTFEYDANGNQTASIDKLTKRWEKTYDALDRVTAERDPEGNIRRVTFDAAGRIKVVTTPNGNPTAHDYDGRSRLRVWTDAEGYRWTYTYDGVGNILDIEDALGGHYVMTYGPRNERLTEKNQDNKSWIYSYDALVRLRTRLDPNGTGRALTYDPANRLESVEFNTGRFNSLGYDNNNNVVSVLRTKSGSPATALYLDYDALDRLTESRDTFSKTVRYGYDVLGRVTTKTYPGGKILNQTYDRLGRLTKLSFAYSGTPLDCTFTYDKAGRLTGRGYPNGITQDNVFDNSGRLASMDYKASGGSSLIALGYAYDRNGNKTSGSEKGTLAWQNSSIADYDDTSRFHPDGKLIDRTDAAAVGGPRTRVYTYDASGNMSLAAAPGETYDLAYDEDNRTTSVHWENGLASKDIVNRYDALGRRVSRKADGMETRYVMDLVGGMERTLCDTDASGNIQAWYVHGPDLCFKVSNTGALTCYHADAMGNVVRTTDTTGTTVNQYAYTPYGRSLDTADSAPNPDPYRFVGSQGVMLELPGLYFMRARYYSADTAVFLATDPVKNIGPGWRPNAYGYADRNPLTYVDRRGEMPHVAAMALGGAITGLITEGISLGVDSWSGKTMDGNDIVSRLAGGAVGGFVGGGLAGLGVVGPAASGVSAFVEDTVRRGFDDDEEVDGGQSGIEALKAGVFAFGWDKLPGIGGNKMVNVSAVVGGQRGVKDMLTSVIGTSVDKSIAAGWSLATSNGGSGSKSLANKTPVANNRATSLNQSQSCKPAPATPIAPNGGGGLSSQTASGISSALSGISSNLSKASKSQLNKIGSLLKQLSSALSKLKKLQSKKK